MEFMQEFIKEFVAWSKEDLLRPTLILVSGMLLFNLPMFIYKVRMLINAILYLLFCWDKSWKKPQDPGAIFGPHLSQDLPVQRKTIYFVRHGESTWNDTFNKGKHRSLAVFLVGFFPGLVKAVVYEIYLILSGKLDSWFYDSPMSTLGLTQIEELAAFLRDKPLDGPEAEHMKILRADPGTPPSKLVSSALRRAVATLGVGLKQRLTRRPEEKILILPSLQEISRNPDTLCITPPHTPIQPSWIERSYPGVDLVSFFQNQTDMSRHAGNKPLGSNGLVRMLEFCEFVFSPECKEEYVIVGGHSIWFRSFFKFFLPYSVQHVSKNNKMVNGAVVTFELMKADTRRGSKYMIDPKTIKVVFGGF